MALVRGPFDVKWGNTTLLDISEISIEFEQESNDYTTIDNRRYTIDGAITATVSATFLKSDVPTLAAVLPQYYVPQGGTMSTGESVTGINGGIDLVAASCESDPVFNNLEITACGTNGQVLRLVNARTKVDGMEIADNSVMTVTVMFVGEPAAGVATLQMFGENDLSVVS
jgi:hypothetical protein